ncbi:MAG: Rieske 2Fe-2S domain-containing protein [Acidobacteriota bacterium]|nr:MAG: Rieske 2Fe-2S domain-containing protein [Acidobacteriota bacterium]
MAEEEKKSSKEGEQPAAKKAVKKKEVARREFNWLALGWTFFAAAAGAGLTATGRFMFPNVLTEPPSSFKAGFPTDFAIGVVDTRFKEAYRVWIVRNDEGMYALSTICTHLGCTPNWLEAENKFKCPCHGSGFYMSGINFEGPAPRPLERFRIVLAEDGQVLIDKSRIYKQEAGQWSDPESFLKLG